jgi:hypothetical protein
MPLLPLLLPSSLRLRAGRSLSSHGDPVSARCPEALPLAKPLNLTALLRLPDPGDTLHARSALFSLCPPTPTAGECEGSSKNTVGWRVLSFFCFLFEPLKFYLKDVTHTSLQLSDLVLSEEQA